MDEKKAASETFYWGTVFNTVFSLTLRFKRIKITYAFSVIGWLLAVTNSIRTGFVQSNPIALSNWLYYGLIIMVIHICHLGETPNNSVIVISDFLAFSIVWLSRKRSPYSVGKIEDIWLIDEINDWIMNNWDTLTRIKLPSSCISSLEI